MLSHLRRGILLSSLALFSPISSLAESGPRAIDLNAAQIFSEDLIAYLQNQHMYGNFNRGRADLEEIFVKVETLLEAAINLEALRVEKIAIMEGEVQLQLQDTENGKQLQLRVLQHQEALRIAQPKVSGRAQSNAQNFQYMIPGTHMIIEEGSRFNSLSSGSFVSIIKNYPIDEFNSARVEAGIQRESFSVSIFGAQSDQKSAIGVKGDLQIKLRSGWSFYLMGLIRESMDVSVNLVEGQFQIDSSRYPGGLMMIQVSKNLEAQNLRLNAGLTLSWSPNDVSSLQPNAVAHLGLAKNFVDKKGRQRGQLEAFVSNNLTSEQREWVFGLRFNMQF